MRKTIKNTFALAALLIAGATSTVSAQATEKEGTIIQTEQVNGEVNIYTIQDETTGAIFKSLPMQAQFAMGERVDYKKIATPTQANAPEISIHFNYGIHDEASGTSVSIQRK